MAHDDSLESIYDVIEGYVRLNLCPSFKIFHEGWSKSGNAWGKFYMSCNKCQHQRQCLYSKDRRGK